MLLMPSTLYTKLSFIYLHFPMLSTAQLHSIIKCPPTSYFYIIVPDEMALWVVAEGLEVAHTHSEMLTFSLLLSY